MTIHKFLVCIMLLLMLSGCAAALFSTPPRIEADYEEPLTSMKFVAVPAGEFLMGDDDGFREDKPVHKVILEGFYVGAFEVTFNEYDIFCKATGRPLPSDEGWGRGHRPVINVSWLDAKAFAEWLSRQNGLSFSLPSESQWEYLARAGTQTSFWTGDSLPSGAANCRDCNSKSPKGKSVVVGSFKPNPWGVYDTLGNVAEWTLDALHFSYKGAPADGSPWFSSDSNTKIHRGGSWRYKSNDNRSASRDWTGQDATQNIVGFRLILKK